MRRPLGDAAAPLLPPVPPPPAPRPPAAFSRIERRLRASLQTLQARDQALLTLGILWVLLGTAWLARSPATFPLAHVLGLPPVLAWLVYSYALRRYWAFYLADYCYFANALAFALFTSRLVLAPRAPPLPPQHDGALAVVFALCLGPLLWANVFWRTTLAFHSPDKMCSVFIHTVAPLACLALRWLPGEGAVAAAAAAAAAPAAPAAPVSLLRHLLLAPLALYLLWQAAYLCVTELGRTGALLRSDARYETSLRFQAAALSRAHAAGRGGALAAAAAAAGLLRRPGAALDAERPAVKAFFMAAQALYTLATLALAALAWHSFPAAAAMVGGVLAHTVHQGAGFYVKVFAARYLSEAQASVEEAKGGGGGGSSGGSGGSGSGSGGGGSSSSEAAAARRSASTPSAAPEGSAAAGFGASAAASAAAAAAAAAAAGAAATTSSRGAFCLPPSVAAQQASLLDTILRKARSD